MCVCLSLSFWTISLVACERALEKSEWFSLCIFDWRVFCICVNDDVFCSISIFCFISFHHHHHLINYSFDILIRSQRNEWRRREKKRVEEKKQTRVCLISSDSARAKKKEKEDWTCLYCREERGSDQDKTKWMNECRQCSVIFAIRSSTTKFLCLVDSHSLACRFKWSEKEQRNDNEIVEIMKWSVEWPRQKKKKKMINQTTLAINYFHTYSFISNATRERRKKKMLLHTSFSCDEWRCWMDFEEEIRLLDVERPRERERRSLVVVFFFDRYL